MASRTRYKKSDHHRSLRPYLLDLSRQASAHPVTLFNSAALFLLPNHNASMENESPSARPRATFVDPPGHPRVLLKCCRWIPTEFSRSCWHFFHLFLIRRVGPSVSSLPGCQLNAPNLTYYSIKLYTLALILVWARRNLGQFPNPLRHTCRLSRQQTLAGLVYRPPPLAFGS